MWSEVLLRTIVSFIYTLKFSHMVKKRSICMRLKEIWLKKQTKYGVFIAWNMDAQPYKLML